MTQHHLATLWSAIGSLLFWFTAAVWLSGIGMTLFTGVIPYGNTAIAREVIALPVVALSLALLAHIGRRYALGSGATLWSARVPVFAIGPFALPGLNTTSQDGKWVQRAQLMALIGLPLAALFHFTRKILKGLVSDRQDLSQQMAPLDPVPLEAILDALFNVDGGGDRFRIGESAAKVPAELDGMVTWFPVVQPALFAVLVALACWTCFRLAHAIGRTG